MTENIRVDFRLLQVLMLLFYKLFQPEKYIKMVHHVIDIEKIFNKLLSIEKNIGCALE